MRRVRLLSKGYRILLVLAQLSNLISRSLHKRIVLLECFPVFRVHRPRKFRLVEVLGVDGRVAVVGTLVQSCHRALELLHACSAGRATVSVSGLHLGEVNLRVLVQLVCNFVAVFPAQRLLVGIIDQLAAVRLQHCI